MTQTAGRPHGHLRVSATTTRAIEDAAGPLATAASQRMEEHAWYRELSASDRSWVGLVAQAGISQFISWFRTKGTDEPGTAHVFGSAPRELTRSITLRETLDLIRSVVNVVEAEVCELAAVGDEQAVREGVLRFSSEIAFAAAEVYAAAAEARGAWDARLEALIVDAVLRGEADDALQSRASALGWDQVADVTVVAGSTGEHSPSTFIDDLRRSIRRHGAQAMIAVQRERAVAIIAGSNSPAKVVASTCSVFGAGPVVVGPTVPHLFDAHLSARAALAGLAVAAAWPSAPRPVMADDLLPERAIDGDQEARRALVERAHQPLSTAGQGELLETAHTFLDAGRQLEATARTLYVHPNTVRYRLGRISEITGYDLHTPRDAWTVQIALTFARLL